MSDQAPDQSQKRPDQPQRWIVSWSQRLRSSLDYYLDFMINPPAAPPVFKCYDLDNICRGYG